MPILPRFTRILVASLLAAGTPGLPGAAPKTGPPASRGYHAYVCGLHFYNGAMHRQVVAHHYCIRQNNDLMQCILFDSNREDARLIGIEYVVSAKLFKTFTPAEKKLWHSHAYEVKSGLLVAPHLDPAQEQTLMRHFANTYGKTWHTWQVDRDHLPLGVPQLMMGFTADGQADPKVVAKRDKDLGNSTEAVRRRRTGLPNPIVDPGADAWRLSAPLQLELRPSSPSDMHRIPMH